MKRDLQVDQRLKYIRIIDYVYMIHKMNLAISQDRPLIGDKQYNRACRRHILSNYAACCKNLAGKTAYGREGYGQKGYERVGKTGSRRNGSGYQSGGMGTDEPGRD